MSDTEGAEESLEKRHRREKRELQAEITRLKHSVPKGDKKRKKEVTAQIALLEEQLNQRHEEEKQQAAEEGPPEQTGADGELAEAVEQLTVADGGKRKKKSKAEKRRERKSEKEHEREAFIREQEEANLMGPRHLEAKALKSLLTARGLHISQIPSDGDCLYAAIAEQLQQVNQSTSVLSLRKQTADYMRTHCEDFHPFLCHTESGQPYTEDDFEDYCSRVEKTKEWGGHLEVQALSNLLGHPIEVLQAEGPSLHVGQHFTTPSLLLSYHRHAFGLGEHYNSVLPGVVEEDEDALRVHLRMPHSFSCCSSYTVLSSLRKESWQT